MLRRLILQVSGISLIAASSSVAQPVVTSGPCAFVLMNSSVAGSINCQAGSSAKYLEEGVQLGMSEEQFKIAVKATGGKWRTVKPGLPQLPEYQEFTYTAMYDGLLMQASHAFEKHILVRSTYGAREDVKTKFDASLKGKDIQPGSTSAALLYSLEATSKACVAQRGISDRLRKRFKVTFDLIRMDRADDAAKQLWRCSQKGDFCAGEGWVGMRIETLKVSDTVSMLSRAETISLRSQEPLTIQAALEWSDTQYFGCQLVLEFATVTSTPPQVLPFMPGKK